MISTILSKASQLKERFEEWKYRRNQAAEIQALRRQLKQTRRLQAYLLKSPPDTKPSARVAALEKILRLPPGHLRRQRNRALLLAATRLLIPVLLERQLNRYAKRLTE